MQLLGLLPGPTIITLYFALWTSGTIGWLACYSVIEGHWAENKSLVRKVKVFQIGFEALARASLFVYLLFIAVLMGGLEGVVMVILSFLLVLQSVLNMRHFLLCTMGLLLFITYLALLSYIYNWLHVVFL